MLRRYEALLLTVPELTADEGKSLHGELEGAIKDAKGMVISNERWGKYKLAYPVKNHEYGIYYLVRFEIQPGTTVVEDIKSLFRVKLSDTVMRAVITQLDMKSSLAYQRPPSLEDAPTRDVGTFLKENQMEGLLTNAAADDEDEDDENVEIGSSGKEGKREFSKKAASEQDAEITE